MIQIFMYMYQPSQTMKKVQMTMKRTEFKYEKTNPFHKILRWTQWDIRMCS